MTGLLALLSVILADRAYVAAASLLLALLCNWLLGTIDAEVRREFSWAEWPRILRSQLASKEVAIIVATYGSWLATATLSTYLQHAGIDEAFVRFVGTQVLNVAVAASGLYSAALWHECLVQLQDIASALKVGPNATKRNFSRLAAA